MDAAKGSTQAPSRCRLCGGRGFTGYAGAPGLLRCLGCGLVFRHPQPDLEALEELYGETYFETGVGDFGYLGYTSSGEAVRREWLRKVRLLERFVPPGRLLDVGCATGEFLAAARPRWQAVGNEISGYARQHRVRRDLTIYPGNFADAHFPEAPFDAVTLWDVIEHLPDPVAACRKAASLLRPGGILALTTGDIHSLPARLTGARWRLITAPHLYYFSFKTLRLLLRKTGFRPIHWSRPMKWVTLGMVWLVLTRTLRRFGLKAPHPVLNSRLAGVAVPATLGDVLLVVARRRTANPPPPAAPQQEP